MAGLGLQGAYGVAGGQDELEKLVAERLRDTLLKQQAAQQQAELALKTRGMDIDERQGDARIGLEGQRVGFEGQRVGLDRDKFGFEQQQWGDMAPQRDANVALTGAQTGEILRQPEKEAADRAHDGSMIDRRGTWNLREIGASGAEQRKTLGFGASLKPPGGAGVGGVSPYSAERARRVVQSVDELIGQRQPDGSYKGGMINGWTSGMGSLLAGAPGTDARLVAGKLKTLGSGIAFNELTEMREASKTGGALGAIAVKELELLESSLGAIDQGLDGADLINELAKVRESMQRWHDTKSRMAGQTSAQIDTGNMGAGNPNANLGGEYDFVNGKLVPRGGGR